MYFKHSWINPLEGSRGKKEMWAPNLSPLCILCLHTITFKCPSCTLRTHPNMAASLYFALKDQPYQPVTVYGNLIEQIVSKNIHLLNTISSEKTIFDTGPIYKTGPSNNYRLKALIVAIDTLIKVHILKPLCTTLLPQTT